MAAVAPEVPATRSGALGRSESGQFRETLCSSKDNPFRRACIQRRSALYVGVKRVGRIKHISVENESPSIVATRWDTFEIYRT